MTSMCLLGVAGVAKFLGVVYRHMRGHNFMVIILTEMRENS